VKNNLQGVVRKEQSNSDRTVNNLHVGGVDVGDHGYCWEIVVNVRR